ncbi:hypothetical protein [Paraburkholderia steynii]|nr:hypothetical protein [Paraburkholderia steynii]
MATLVFLRVSRVVVLDGAGPQFDEAGSEMFRPVAGPLQEGDTAVLQLSGEEFGLVLASANNEGSRNSCKRVSTEAKVSDWVHLATGRTEVDTTLEQASAALYAGRCYGRNRVCEAQHV